MNCVQTHRLPAHLPNGVGSTASRQFTNTSKHALHMLLAGTKFKSRRVAGQPAGELVQVTLHTAVSRLGDVALLKHFQGTSQAWCCGKPSTSVLHQRP